MNDDAKWTKIPIIIEPRGIELFNSDLILRTFDSSAVDNRFWTHRSGAGSNRPVRDRQPRFQSDPSFYRLRADGLSRGLEKKIKISFSGFSFCRFQSDHSISKWPLYLQVPVSNRLWKPAPDRRAIFFTNFKNICQKVRVHMWKLVNSAAAQTPKLVRRPPQAGGHGV